MRTLIFICVYLCLSVANCLAADWQAAGETPTGVEVVRGGGKVVTVTMAAWGPGWKWFECDGPAKADANGVRGLQQNVVINGTAARLNVDCRAKQGGANGVEMSYGLSASDSVEMIGVAAVVRPGEGAKMSAVLEDGSETACDYANRGAFQKVVKKLILTTGDQQRIEIAVSPARLVESDWGELRVWMIKGKANGKEQVGTKLAITFPSAVKFYARDAEAKVWDITPAWFAYPTAMAGTPVDLSFLNKDASGKFVQAGAHGFLRVKGDGFEFEDGTPARFWGVNLTAAAALGSYQRSAQLADRLARLGCNVVRLHHLDSDWSPNIIDREASDGTTQHLDAKDMARLDRLIYELKVRGIYVIFDPWVGRTYRPGDQVPGSEKFRKGNFGLHPYIFFDPRMRELHKQFLKQVWTHVNEFTHVAYKDEPAIATTECANEALFDLSLDGPTMPEPYRREFLLLYKRWCAENGQTPSPGDDVITKNYPVQHQRFHQWVLREFFADIRKYLKEEIGVKVPINDTNWFHWPWEIGAQLGGDFMDSHHYYHGNRIGPTAAMGGLWVSNPLRNPEFPFAGISAMGILGKPLTSSECGDNPPQTYRSAYYVGLAAVGCLQGYDSLTPYAYSQSNGAEGKLSNFEMESDPASVASIAAGALIYRRGDVSPGRDLAVMLVKKDEQYAMHWENNYEKAFDRTSWFRAMTETHRLAVVFGEESPKGAVDVKTPAEAASYEHAGTELKSDTGEIWRDWAKGVGTIDTPRTQAAYGMLGELEKPLATRDATFDIATPFATVVLSSLTEEPLASSGKLLLTAAARAEDANQAYNLSRTRLAEWGRPPVMAEPVVGTVTFATSAKALTARALLPNGEPGAVVPVTIEKGRATMELKGEFRTIFYQIAAVP